MREAQPADAESWFKLGDKDEDHFLSLEEFIDLTLMRSHFEEADRDNDGKLSFAEYMEYYPKAPKGRLGFSNGYCVGNYHELY